MAIANVTGLTIITDDTYVDIYWDALGAVDLAGYRVSLSTDGAIYGIYNELGFAPGVYYFVDIATLSYRISDLVNDQLYYFKVQSVNTSSPPDVSDGSVITGTPWSTAGSPVEPDIIVQDPTRNLTPIYAFDFEDTPGDTMTAFDLELSDVSDFSHIVYRNLYPASYASYISDMSGMSAASYFSGWKGYPPGSSSSGMSSTWYDFAIPITLVQGSYFLRIRTRDNSGHYSNFGVSSFVVDTTVTGVQIVAVAGNISNNRNIQMELRVPDDVTEYIMSESSGFLPSFGMTTYVPYTPNVPPSVSSVTFDVSYTGSGFVPSNTMITKGDKVTFTNNSTENVIIVSDGVFNSGAVLPGNTYTYTFTGMSGVFHYYSSTETTKSGTVDVLNYSNAKTLSWSLSAGVGSKTVYARFKDRAGNESELVQAYILLALPSLIRPFNNESVMSTLPILEWTVPQSVNGHKVHFKLDVDTSSAFDSHSGQPLMSYETAKNPEMFKYKLNINDVNWIPFPLEGATSNTGVVAYMIDSDLDIHNTYYWRVQIGT